MYPEARFMMNLVLGRVKGRFLLTRFVGKSCKCRSLWLFITFYLLNLSKNSSCSLNGMGTGFTSSPNSIILSLIHI